MTIGNRPICSSCKHFEPERGRPKCRAFRGGIREEIYRGSRDHREPFPGDNRICFAPSPRSAGVAAALDDGSRKYIEEVTGGMPQCHLCKHETGPHYCKAFPDVVPDVITAGIHGHRKPYPGDNGIRFEPRGSEQDA